MVFRSSDTSELEASLFSGLSPMVVLLWCTVEQVVGNPFTHTGALVLAMISQREVGQQ